MINYGASLEDIAKRCSEKKVVEESTKDLNTFVLDEQVVDEVTGRLGHSSKVVYIDPNEELSNYKASDFYLENLISSGAIDNLGQVHFGGSSLCVADNAVSQLEKISVAEE